MSSEPAGVPTRRRLQLRDTYEGREGPGWHPASPGLPISIIIIIIAAAAATTASAATFAHAWRVSGVLSQGRGPWPRACVVAPPQGTVLQRSWGWILPRSLEVCVHGILRGGGGVGGGCSGRERANPRSKPRDLRQVATIWHELCQRWPGGQHSQTHPVLLCRQILTPLVTHCMEVRMLLGLGTSGVPWGHLGARR